MDKTDELLRGKYPAKAHAAKVAAYLKAKDPSSNGLIYLEGQKTRLIEDNDEPVPFRSVTVHLPRTVPLHHSSLHFISMSGEHG